MELGCLRQSSSRDVSCMTTNAGTPCCWAVQRRHSRMYSRNSGSTASLLLEASSPALECAASRWGSMPLPLDFLEFGRSTGVLSHSGSPLHTSQVLQFAHFGISP